MPQSARLVLNQANLRARVAALAALAGSREAPGASAAASVAVKTRFTSQHELLDSCSTLAPSRARRRPAVARSRTRLMQVKG